MTAPARAPADLIEELGLVAHVEGGHWAQTWIGPPTADGRPVGTSIVYLLVAGERSHWHRVDATEVWHFHDGAPLTLALWDGNGPVHEHELRPHRPQVVVPAGVWQSASTEGRYTLAGCTVAPGFVAAGFELAPAGWEPPS